MTPGHPRWQLFLAGSLQLAIASVSNSLLGLQDTGAAGG